MASTSSSSSSSSSLDSSSSSFYYSTSSSSSSSSSSIDSSSSSSSSSFSSSSSSSSSSYLDYHESKTFEFNYGDEKIKPVWKLAYGTEYIFAGTGDGKILRSSNGFHWEEYYQADDVNISAMYVYNNKLYIGTSPHGRIYIIDLELNQTILSQSLNGGISNFIDYGNNIYVSTNNPSGFYRYNNITKIWDLFYKPYGTCVNKIIKSNEKLLFFMNVNQIISFDGNNFILVKI